MCRIVGYLGPERSLEEVLVTPPHALVAQSRHPRELPPDILNADGYGYAFYDAPNLSMRRPEPAVYRSILPMWGDENLSTLVKHLRSACIIASTRSATNTMPTAISNTAPYVRGNLSFVHNGAIDAFHEKLMRRFREPLTDQSVAQIRGNTDTEHLFALFLHHLGERTGREALEDAMTKTLRRVRGWLREEALHGQLNLLVSDGDAIVVTRSAVTKRPDEEPPSLYALASGEGHACIASEPYDDHKNWKRVAPETMVSIDRSTEMRSLSLST